MEKTREIELQTVGRRPSRWDVGPVWQVVSPRHAKRTGWSGTVVGHSGHLRAGFAFRKLDDTGLFRIVDGTEQSLIT